jgi:hypothetical protein
MAAEYGININVRTKDEQLKRLQKELTKTDATVKKLANSLERIEKKGRAGSGRPGGPFSAEAIAKRKELAQATKEAAKAFEAYTKGALNFDGANKRGITSTRELATRMKDVAASAGITSKKFELFTQGATKFNFSAQIKSLQRFNESAKITASTFGAMGSKNVPGIAGFSNADISTLLNFAPANTISAIERYLDTLTGVRKQLDISEKEYKDVTGRIKEMNKALEEQRNLLRENSKEGKISRQMRSEARDIRQRIAESPAGRFRRFRRGRTAEDRRIRNQVGSSALIGGAFPLLFGQGLAASAGGFAGGAGGGLIGGQAGFALSLVGTQVGAQFDKLAQSAMELGKALRNPIENIDLLIQKLGAANTPFADTVATLKSLGLEAVAAQQVLDQFNKTFGTNKQTLDSLSEESIRFENELQKLGTGMAMFVAGPLTFFLEKINRALGFQTVSGLKADAQAQAVKEARLQRGQANVPGGAKTGNPIIDFFKPGLDLFFEGKIRDDIDVEARAAEIFEQEMNKIGLGGTEGTRNFANEDLQKLIKERRDFELSTLQSQLEIQQKSLTFRNEDLDVLKKRIDLAKINEQITVKEKNLSGLLTDEARNQVQFELDKLNIQKQISEELLNQSIIMADPVKAALVDLNKEMAKFNDARFQAVEFAKAFESAFENSFKGIIKGTMTVQDAFRSMFMRIADHFLDMAAQMVSTQITKGILGLIAGSFGGGGSDVFAGKGFTAATPGEVTIADFNRANGGPVKGGNSYIVGERGPELFSPGVSGMITPNNAFGGTTSVVVNVDASNSSVEGDESGGEELGRLIGAAVQAELIKERRPGGLLG